MAFRSPPQVEVTSHDVSLLAFFPLPQQKGLFSEVSPNARSIAKVTYWPLRVMAQNFVALAEVGLRLNNVHATFRVRHELLPVADKILVP